MCPFYAEFRVVLMRQLDDLLDMTAWRRIPSTTKQAVALLGPLKTVDPDTDEDEEANAATTEAVYRVTHQFLNRVILKRRAAIEKFQHSLEHASIPPSVERAADAHGNA